MDENNNEFQFNLEQLSDRLEKKGEEIKIIQESSIQFLKIETTAKRQTFTLLGEICLEAEKIKTISDAKDFVVSLQEKEREYTRAEEIYLNHNYTIAVEIVRECRKLLKDTWLFLDYQITNYKKQ